MAAQFEISVETRHHTGKGPVRRLRNLEKKVPAVVYGAGKPALSVMLTQHQLGLALQNEALYSHILTLKVDGVEEKVVLKDLHRHPSKPMIMHADFMRISATEKLTMNIPLHFTHEDIAPGVKLQNGIISHMLSEVEVRCLPADLPEFIAVDMSQMKLDDTLYLSDLKVPQGVELVALMHEDDRPVVNIHKLIVIEEPVEVAAISAAEVPVVGKEGKEGVPAEGAAPAADANKKEGGKK